MIDSIFIFGAKYVIYIAAIIALAYFFYFSKKQKLQSAIFIVITLPLVYVVAKLGSHFYFDPRPFVVGHFTPLVAHATDNGFPSDHTLLASALAAAFFPFKKAASYILWLCTLYIAYSRVYVGVHHPIDVIGSIIISIVVTSLLYWILKSRTRFFA